MGVEYGTRDRLAVLVAQYDLPASAAGRLGVLLERLAADDRAPTAVRAPIDAVDAHVADALVALDLAPVRAARHLADLGSGAGIPALVLAAALPDAQVAAVESTHKKAGFIVQTAQAMGLTNVDVIPLRIEEWDGGHGRHDVVTARALAALPVVAEYAAPLLAPAGLLVAWKGTVDEPEAADGAAAAAELGLGVPEMVAVQPFPAARERTLYLYLKVGSTPNRYPRRAGMASKRPLHA